MKRKLVMMMVAAVSLIIMSGLASASAAKPGDIPKMTKEQLKDKLDDSEVVVVDVRVGKDWSASDSKIKGAVRYEPKKAKDWAKDLDKNKVYVLY